MLINPCLFLPVSIPKSSFNLQISPQVTPKYHMKMLCSTPLNMCSLLLLKTFLPIKSDIEQTLLLLCYQQNVPPRNLPIKYQITQVPPHKFLIKYSTAVVATRRSHQHKIPPIQIIQTHKILPIKSYHEILKKTVQIRSHPPHRQYSNHHTIKSGSPVI